MTDDNSLNQFVTNINREREEELTQRRAQELHLEYQNLVGHQPEPAAVGIVPKELANSGQVFAYDKANHVISLALTDPTSPATLSALKRLASLDEYQFKPVLVSKSSMRYLLQSYDTFAPTVNQKRDLSLDTDLVTSLTKVDNLTTLQEKLTQANTSQLIETLLAGAAGTKSSDIHIEPT